MATQDRRVRERASRRARILDAAAELIVRDGFSSTGVAAIAERAEFNVGTLYYYYSSKEILYLGVLLRALDLLIPKLEETAAAPGTARERLGRIAEAYRSFFAEHPESQAIIQCVQSGLIEPTSDEEAQMVAQAYKGTARTIGIVARVISEGTATGEFHKIDARESTLFFWASLTGVLQLAGHKAVFRSSIDDGLLDRWVERFTFGLGGQPS